MLTHSYRADNMFDPVKSMIISVVFIQDSSQRVKVEIHLRLHRRTGCCCFCPLLCVHRQK